MISKAWFWCWVYEINRSTQFSTNLSLLLLVGVSCYIWLKGAMKEEAQLPPGPLGLPLIGNILNLDRQLHSCFAKLAHRYGPVFKVRLGAKICIVFSSPSVAKQVLNDLDTIFADRYNSALSSSVSYGGKDLVMAPYENHWQMLREIWVKKLINHARIVTFSDLCRREARKMVNQINSKTGSPITLREEIHLTAVNITTGMMWGSTLDKEERDRVSAECIRVAQGVLRLLGEFNISDFFPALAPFDLQGKERKLKKNIVSLDKIFDKVIERKRNQMQSSGEYESEEKEEDFLNILLPLIDQGDPKIPFSVTHLKALFLDLVLSALESTTGIIEWAMSEILNQPKILANVLRELEQVVGMNDVVEELHLPKLPYLHAVVKEVLRLHPLGPLLLPRSTKESCIVGGYMIPKGAITFVNVWSIHRDPKHWVDPLEFRPERFLKSTSEWDFNGSDLRYFPFGSGRRMCVGIPIVETQISYLLASLMHSFEWKLPEGLTLDLSEVFGVNLMKKTPLVAIPTPRLQDPNLYN